MFPDSSSMNIIFHSEPGFEHQTSSSEASAHGNDSAFSSLIWARTPRRFGCCRIISGAMSSPALVSYTASEMNIERIIDDIQQLEEMFEAPDIRPLSASDISAANRRHDQALAGSPWFRLWQSYGVCCRPETPVFQLPGTES
jgi:hypothetical protein